LHAVRLAETFHGMAKAALNYTFVQRQDFCSRGDEVLPKVIWYPLRG
jgi:hypothetical protein